MFPFTRLQRLRQNHSLKNLVRETHLNPDKLILPLFIKDGIGIKKPIDSLTGHYQFSLDQLDSEIKLIKALGIKGIILFGIPAKKDALGSESFSDTGIIQKAIPIIKHSAPNLIVITDVCFCEYTNHGHCGIIKSNHFDQVILDNDQTLLYLAKQAVSHAKAGADIIAPSGNIDGMVQAIRIALDGAGFTQIPILSYAVKYASSLYGPFRQAAEGAPQFGDRSSYQMDYGNAYEALRECELDIAEGADMLMVKPAHTYLDIIYRVKKTYPALPLCAYQTSGEFAYLKAAAEKGWLVEDEAIIEVLTAIKRAGADFIVTYFAKTIAERLE